MARAACGLFAHDCRDGGRTVIFGRAKGPHPPSTSFAFCFPNSKRGVCYSLPCSRSKMSSKTHCKLCRPNAASATAHGLPVVKLKFGRVKRRLMSSSRPSRTFRPGLRWRGKDVPRRAHDKEQPINHTSEAVVLGFLSFADESNQAATDFNKTAADCQSGAQRIAAQQLN